MGLEINNISKRYGELKALDNVSFKINNGMFGLLGPNGAGKTTLMRTITTLLPIEEGSITYNDIKWQNGDEVRKIIGYLPQHFSIYKNLKVYEALEHMAILKNVDNAKEEVSSVLNKVNLYSDKNKKIKQLSGGMLRKVGIAQAILGNPKILVVDEPTAGLDPENRIKFRNLLRDISKDRIIIISTHIVEDIENTCNEIGILKKGSLLFSGNVIDFLEKAKGHIYEVDVNREEFNDISSRVRIISSKTFIDGYNIRFLIKNENEFIPKNAKVVSPSLEDAYLYVAGRDANE
ncbi:ABC transporter ATP-binding protein [Clostridium ihumii]|uniref:ABC transporter ATP-binding protein n=1 Tax=Clostridium ihumii TaxID=1470356 RepID=UPI003D348F33